MLLCSCKNFNCPHPEKLHTLESGIDVGPTVINLAFFSRPYGLIKGPTFINFWNFFQALRLIQFAHFVQSDFFFNIVISLQYDFFSHTSLHIICQIFPALWLFFFPNFPCPTFIQGPTFILFAKSSRPYAYSLPYVYYGLQSISTALVAIVNSHEHYHGFVSLTRLNECQIL